MKIIINNVEFDYDLGCRLFKMKYAECPKDELADIWNDIQPMTFTEIAQNFKSIEQRRVAIGCLGLDNLVAQIKPILMDKSSIEKTTTWVGEDGKLIETKFTDTYELYKVSKESLLEGADNSWIEDAYYVKCKDTSTDRDYLIWVDLGSVFRTNNPNSWFNRVTHTINAIQAVAWTIQTNIEENNIEKIVRQGDCVLIKPINSKSEKIGETRHLTEKEYRELLVAES
jgi:hypothetical protein